MGRAKIFPRPTPILRKQMGQMYKLIWSERAQKDPIEREVNPATNICRTGVPEFLSQTRGVRTSHITRRQFVLNRHFTEIISDVLATNFKERIDELGINITSIETKAWNKGVSVFYSTSGPYNEETRLKLKELVAKLRASITERQLIGRTPHITFVYDETVLLGRALTEALSKVDLNEKKESRLIKVSSSNQLYVSKDLGSQEPKLISKRFVAPLDMDNTMCGLNYPELYDDVASKLIRGRGESSRMVQNSDVMASAKPLFRAPRDDSDEIDPATRVLRMQKFIISQKQKSIHLARLKRKQEILSREALKWDVQENSEQDNEPIKYMRPEDRVSESYYHDHHEDENEMQSSSENK